MLATPHTESRPTSTMDGLLRSPEFWFYDGNVVLIAGSTAFKVHRGQLARHSDVFHGLFSIPQPQDEHSMDDCPCVQLHDQPSDVTCFLSALYDGFYFDKPRADDFPIIAGVLRLSSKYLVESLRQQCILRLEHEWPSTLAGWDRREQESTNAQAHYSPRDLYAHPILVLELAVELNLPSLFPAALYDLSRYGPSKILSGTAVPLPAHASPQDSADPPGHFVAKLTRDLLCRTLRGREDSQKYISRFVEKVLVMRPISPECLNKDTDRAGYCIESFYFITLNMLRSVGGVSSGRDADPLFSLVQAMDMLSRTDFSDGRGTKRCGLRMCHMCKVEFAKEGISAREEIWRLIPQWFGLQEASELKTKA
ncbi:hypothetical protein HGRIS_014324 [Hohenbuehelia grisea]|uniref:BTB domain-containing protein n=1 Tax=Hohenbuehelia grisea TaxID=104357 RepID=A0ABR3JV97_9AGAR